MIKHTPIYSPLPHILLCGRFVKATVQYALLTSERTPGLGYLLDATFCYHNDSRLFPWEEIILYGAIYY